MQWGLGLRVLHEGMIREEVGSVCVCGGGELGRMEWDSLTGLWAGGLVFPWRCLWRDVHDVAAGFPEAEGEMKTAEPFTT